ncbi:hypothetical protein CHRYSEOSP005_10560 [Chryseobacterium sp. Alg-005]|uniref:hypothetical protein n=1 Tax=Chryseobacterium sp. Alg-005 TaxID=3159516 RepID=UPI00355575D0
MKKIILLASVIISFSVKSQIKALTEDGKEVVLLDNKTWKYVNESDEKTLETISNNEQPFEKSKDATFLIKSKRIDAGLYYNPKKWKPTKVSFSSPTLEQVFTHSSSPNLFALFVSESAPIQTLKNLKDLIISGIQKNADYFRLKESEYRTVNGLKMLHIKYSANTKGIDFEYIGNYYLTSDGYCGVTVYTFANKYGEYKNEIENFASGLVKTEKAEVAIDVVEVAPPPPMSTKKSK